MRVDEIPPKNIEASAFACLCNNLLRGIGGCQGGLWMVHADELRMSVSEGGCVYARLSRPVSTTMLRWPAGRQPPSRKEDTVISVPCNE
jgi:hypothetical protein